MDLQGLLNYVKDQTKNDWNDESAPNYEFGDPLYSLVSAINHPVHAIPHLLDFIDKNVKKTTNPFSSDEDKVEGALNLAGGAQTGALPFAPESAPGLLGTLTKGQLNKVFEWLKRQGVSEDIAAKGTNLLEHHGKVEETIPEAGIFDPSGKQKGPQFIRPKTDEHILRILYGTNELAHELGFPQKEISDVVLPSTLTHDAGKAPIQAAHPNLLSRTKYEGATGEGFPNKIEGLLTPDEVKDLPSGPMKKMMENFYQFNKPGFEFKGFSNMTPEEWKVIDSHAPRSVEAASRFGFPKELSELAAYHHDKLIKDGIKQDIPEISGMQSLVDTWDAITSGRYGMARPSHDVALERLKYTSPKKDTLSSGTQFMPNLYNVFTDPNAGLTRQLYHLNGLSGDDLIKQFEGLFPSFRSSIKSSSFPKMTAKQQSAYQEQTGLLSPKESRNKEDVARLKGLIEDSDKLLQKNKVED